MKKGVDWKILYIYIYIYIKIKTFIFRCRERGCPIKGGHPPSRVNSGMARRAEHQSEHHHQYVKIRDIEKQCEKFVFQYETK